MPGVVLHGAKEIDFSSLHYVKYNISGEPCWPSGSTFDPKIGSNPVRAPIVLSTQGNR